MMNFKDDGLAAALAAERRPACSRKRKHERVAQRRD